MAMWYALYYNVYVVCALVCVLYRPKYLPGTKFYQMDSQVVKEENDRFKGVYKKYKRRDRPLDTTDVINFHNLEEHLKENVRTLFCHNCRVTLFSDDLKFRIFLKKVFELVKLVTMTKMCIHYHILLV